MVPLPLIELVGCVLGILGGALNCTTSIRNKVAGFATWFVSNALMAYWGSQTGNWSTVAMYVFFLSTSSYGLWMHWKMTQ
jgi:hypothetical protein